MTLPSNTAEMPQVQRFETDVLIIGSGPAGASLACFLAAHGVKGIMVSPAGAGAELPHTHIMNMATFECFRDIGLEDVLKTASSPLDDSNNLIRWGLSMAGRELARRHAFYSAPQRMGEFEMASPCEHRVLSQPKLESELVGHAALNGFQIRWDTEFRTLSETNSEATVELFDKITQQTYAVLARYVFGADGAGSPVAKHLDLPLSKVPAPEWADWAVDVAVKADLSHLMKSRPSVMSWMLQIHRDHAMFNMACIVRMVKPWNEWVFSFLPVPIFKEETFSNEQYLNEIRHVIGDETPVEITSVSRWRMTGAYAQRYSTGRVFLLGDSVHSHSPVVGLGSNTGVQDAYNLAWKVAYVLQNKANPRLLDSYGIERQPVGKDVVRHAKESLDKHARIFEAIHDSPSVAKRMETLSLLNAATPAGEQLRAELQSAIDSCIETDTNGLGIELNQDYSGSPAIHRDTRGDTPVLECNPDPMYFHRRTSAPGLRLPHAWLNTAVPSKDVSTIDLAGKGRFAIFTGIGGSAWGEAAAKVSAELGVPIRIVSIGYGQEFGDLYGDWARIRSVESSGVLVVRPDNVVAWRHDRAEGDGAWATERLGSVMKGILALED